MKNELYESYYLNYISPIPRSLLEEVAQASISANCVSQISKVRRILTVDKIDSEIIFIYFAIKQKKVFDQYLNFISLDDELFCLRHQHRESISYYC